MARQSNSITDYRRIGLAKGIEFVGPSVPSSVQVPTRWRCRNCGRVMHKTYFAVSVGKHGCRCQNDQSLQQMDYVTLADTLGLEWLGGEYFPANNKVKTTWFSPKTNSRFMASYHELAYDNVPSRLRKYLR